MKSPKAISLKDLPEETEINSLEDSNCVLSFLGYKTKLEGQQLLQQLEELNKETGLLNNIDFERLKENEEKVEFLKSCEKKCDTLEINLANLKDKLAEYEKLNSLEIKDLEEELSSYNHNFNDIQFETINLEVIKSIFAFIRGEPVEESVINALSYVKEIEGYNQLIRKHEILDEMGTGYWDLITKGDTVKVEDLCVAMGGDRIEALELLYSLQSADVISLDSVNGLFRLKK